MLTRYRLHNIPNNKFYAVYDKKQKKWTIASLRQLVYLRKNLFITLEHLERNGFKIDHTTPPYCFNTVEGLKDSYPELFI